jgi:hypothetical protein
LYNVSSIVARGGIEVDETLVDMSMTGQAR